jgi:hypothetical protein
MNTKTALCATVILIGALTGPPALVQSVKITPLGSHDGELCQFDRALIFEDPDGTRLLYDPGRTVRGGSDPRLGRTDAILLSHVHADHLGDEHQADFRSTQRPRNSSPRFSLPIAGLRPPSTPRTASSVGAAAR